MIYHSEGLDRWTTINNIVSCLIKEVEYLHPDISGFNSFLNCIYLMNTFFFRQGQAQHGDTQENNNGNKNKEVEIDKRINQRCRMS